MRFTAALLLLALLGVQGQFWFGPRSVAEVSALRTQLADQQQRNQTAREQLVRLRAELKDLREGLEMVEEKARAELGMVKSDEILVQYTRATAAHATPAHDPATVPGALPNTGSGAAGGPAPAASGP